MVTLKWNSSRSRNTSHRTVEKLTEKRTAMLSWVFTCTERVQLLQRINPCPDSSNQAFRSNDRTLFRSYKKYTYSDGRKHPKTVQIWPFDHQNYLKSESRNRIIPRLTLTTSRRCNTSYPRSSIHINSAVDKSKLYRRNTIDSLETYQLYSQTLTLLTNKRKGINRTCQ